MVPHFSRRVPRVLRYFGSIFRIFSFRLPDFYRLWFIFPDNLSMIPYYFVIVLTLNRFLFLVWAPPFSLAATWGIDVSFFSSAYLDVSVRQVPFLITILFVMGYLISLLSEFPHSDIHDCNGCLLLIIAFRSLPRPSSALITKAFSLCSFFLNLFFRLICLFNFAWLRIVLRLCTFVHILISNLACYTCI